MIFMIVVPKKKLKKNREDYILTIKRIKNKRRCFLDAISRTVCQLFTAAINSSDIFKEYTQTTDDQKVNK